MTAPRSRRWRGAIGGLVLGVLLLGTAEAAPQDRGSIFICNSDPSSPYYCPGPGDPPPRPSAETLRAQERERQRQQQAALEAQRRADQARALQQRQRQDALRLAAAEARQRREARVAEERANAATPCVRQTNAHQVRETFAGRTEAEARSRIAIPASCVGGQAASTTCSASNWAWRSEPSCTVVFQCPARTVPCASNQQ